MDTWYVMSSKHSWWLCPNMYVLCLVLYLDELMKLDNFKKDKLSRHIMHVKPHNSDSSSFQLLVWLDFSSIWATAFIIGHLAFMLDIAECYHILCLIVCSTMYHSADSLYWFCLFWPYLYITWYLICECKSNNKQTSNITTELTPKRVIKE